MAVVNPGTQHINLPNGGDVGLQGHGDLPGDVEHGVEKVAHGVKSTATAIPDFLGDLASANLWIRVGEVLFGSFLLIIGIDRITDAHAVQKVVKSGALL
jgi:hypothetical protein